ncbi:EpsG family protein [Lactiplantibacillus plantarum]|nr:EpsG family protein [Lactiplantibacillus plantarum]MCG0644313.1 EpsG family protein [Lactiplantibacillus plantarum]MCG0647429.1 EpsG family protein [Lactiplantibacillus plantarum]MCG0653603.1 EpsG family protein [Lactiplantibacillus plantarum]MCG0786518.1 EpsG family protein [Lactiplantibacillus plantarum]
MIYYVCFGISTLFFELSKLLREKNKILEKVLLILGIIIISLLSYFRDFSIGTDINVYGNFLFINSTYFSKFSNYLEFIKSDNIELGYSFLNFFVSRFTSNPHAFYFILSLITNMCFFFPIFKLRRNVDISLAWITYLFLFFGYTFNYLRQSIALGLTFISMYYILNNKFLRSVIFLILAILFHRTAFIIGIVYIEYIYINKYGKKVNFKNVFFSVFIILCVVFIMYVYGSNLLSDKYSQYLIQARFSDSSKVVLGMLVYRLPMIILIYICMQRERRKKNLLSSSELMLWYLLIYDVIISLAFFNNSTIMRVSLYFAISKIISYNLFLEKLFSKHRFIYKTIYVLIIGVIFFIQVIIQGNNQIYPYKVSDDFSLIKYL